MSKHSIFTRKFLIAIIGNADVKRIGDFVLYKEKRFKEGKEYIEGISVITPKILEERLKAGDKVVQPFRGKIRKVVDAEKKRIKSFTPAPISDDELEFIEGSI